MNKNQFISGLVVFLFSAIAFSVTLDDFPIEIRKYMSGFLPRTEANPHQPATNKLKRVGTIIDEPAPRPNTLRRVSTSMVSSYAKDLANLDILLSHKKSLPEVIEAFKSRGFDTDNLVDDKKKLLEIALDYVVKYHANDEQVVYARDKNPAVLEQAKAVYRLVIAMILEDQKILRFKRKNFKVDSLIGVAAFIVKYEEFVGDFDELIMENFSAQVEQK